MIQYFNWGSSHPGPLKQLPILKQAIKICKISYPHNSITKLSPALAKAHNTQQIDLSYNKITIIQPLYQLRKLKIVNLSNNQISNISKGILKLKKLQKIDLSFNLLGQMSNINVLFELYRVRRGQLTFILDDNKVLDSHKTEIDEKLNTAKQQIKKIKQKIQSKQQLKDLQISKTLEIPKRLHTITVDEEKSSSKNNVTISHAEAKNQIQNSLNSLNTYSRKFQVIASSQFKGWNQNLLCIFRKEAESVRSLLQVYKNIIKLATQHFVNPTDATSKIQIGFIQASEIQQLIKDQHCCLLQALSQCHQVPMTSYKVWVHLYRELRNLSENIRWQVWSIIQLEIRNQQIQALKLISPSKEDKNQGPKLEQLQGLLFSKQKQGQQADNHDCSQCFIKNQQIRQLKQIIELLTHENSDLKIKVETLTQQNQAKSKQEAILGKQLKRRQQQIIESLNQKIDASVYQKVLLQQAKGIEDLIKCDRNLYSKAKICLDNTQKMNELCQTATALAKDKTIGYQRQRVSQFYSQQNQNLSANQVSKMPYFNKNADNNSNNMRKGSKYNQSSISSTQKKRKCSYQNGLRRDRNQYVNSSNSRSKSNLFSLKKTQRLESQQSINRKNKKQNDQKINKESKVLISDFAITQPAGKQNINSNSPITSRQVLAQLIHKKINDSNLAFHNKNIVKDNKNLTNNKRKEGLDSKNGVQDMPTYTHFQYHSVNSKDEQPYQRYMKFHLRNSIIETLQKKGKRYSLNKEGQCQNTMRILSKQKKQSKSKKMLSESNRKIALSDRNLKSKQQALTTRDIIHSNIKSYGQILGRLRN